MSTSLRERILAEGEVVGDGVMRLTTFFNHEVDAGLMELCGKELGGRFEGCGVTKVLTAPTSGLLAAYPIGIRLGVPFIYTRTVEPITFKGEKLLTSSSTSRTTSRPTTHSILASTLTPSDRVLITDDFLATGTTMLSLADLVQQSGATVVGFAAFVEKSYTSGRDALAPLRVETLVALTDPATLSPDSVVVK